MATTQENKKLIIAVLLRYIAVGILLGLLFFLTAGSLSYLNGWIYIGTMLLLMGVGFIILYKKDKALLEKRMKSSEKQKQQIVFVISSGILILLIYILPGLDYRYKWSYVPNWLVAISWIMVSLGYSMNICVMLQNSYASRVVEVQEKQKLIDTGLYSFVRHPMYLAIIPIYVFSPLMLGSFVALIPGILFPFTLILRIINEEKVLVEGLEGYFEYTKKVKYRLIPYIW